jgi:hypothetical protein
MRAGAGDGFLHVGIIYTDMRDRNKKIDSCLEENDVRCDRLKVLSAHPAADASHFASQTRGRAWRGGMRPRIVDVRGFCRPDYSTERVLASFRAEFLGEVGGPHTVLMGDFAHLIYDRFDVKMSLEGMSEDLSKTANVLCCHRAEGFWSLDPSQIAALFDVHQSMMFRSQKIVMAPPVQRPGSLVAAP